MDPSLYLDRDTWVHRLDPRTKMFLLLGMFALPFVFLDPLYELAVLALVLFFGYLARALVNLRRIWFILLTILVVTTILWSIFGSGRTPLFLFVEREALLYGFSTALRIIITVIAGMIFLSTTRNEEVGIGLVRLGIPYRFAFAVSTALRLVPTVVAKRHHGQPLLPDGVVHPLPVGRVLEDLLWWGGEQTLAGSRLNAALPVDD